MAPFLPLELLDAVFQFLSASDLARLSRSCSRYHPVARRLLYRHVAVAPVYKNLSLLLTLARKPDIARHVRSFSIELAGPDATVSHSYYRQLSIALSFMTELKSLNLSLDPSTTWVLQGVKAHSLTRFSSNFSLDHYVTRFLEHTHSLLELELGPPHAMHISSVPPFVPLLEQFSGPTQIAELIVPGRPVKSVQLTSGDLTESVVEQLAKSSVRIDVLSATSSLSAPRLLDLLSKHMRYLVYLRMMTICSVTEAPDVNYYDNVANGLASLPDLRAFEFSGMHWGTLNKTKMELEQAVWQAKPLDAAFAVDQSLEMEDYSEIFFGL
ncbi:hypothetical protein VNI00_001077 [Paramarasmius palmivorus]|uniref:F-box domain-containing protein n=1 Tax=Paramarasmius palmivorus TaxID=297713 RepID=A0AAW0E6J5_9AGAR